MLLQAAGATRPDGANCTNTTATEGNASAADLWDIHGVAGAEAMLACALAASRIDRHEVARLARVVELRDRISRERSMPTRAARPAPLLPPRASVPSAGGLALGGISAAGIALGQTVSRAA